MNYSVFGRFQWIRVDANILETMTRKTEKKKIVLARVDGPLAGAATSIRLINWLIKRKLANNYFDNGIIQNVKHLLVPAS